MYKCINGFTKAKMIEVIKKGNKNKRAVVNGVCTYLADDGNRCPIGCFIPDGHSGQKNKGDVRCLLAEYPDLKAFMPLEAKALSNLQEVHDWHSDYSYYNDGSLSVHASLERWINENVSE